MKALVITYNTRRDEVAQDKHRVQSCFMSLDAMGISFDRAVFEALPSTASINEYDFVVIPRTYGAGATDPRTLFEDAGITIPIFALFVSLNASTWLGSNIGASGAVIATTSVWVDVPWTTSPLAALYSGCWTLTTGKALATISATNPDINAVFTGGAQTNAGKACVWRGRNEGDSNYVYCSGLDSLNQMYLPFLIQEAINDGALSAVPRKSPWGVDIDHINHSDIGTDLTLLDYIVGKANGRGILWCGIFDNEPSYFDTMSTEFANALKAVEYPSGPLKYCYHTHKNSIQTSGPYPNHTELVNKATQESEYDWAEGIWNANGLTFHTPAYYNSGTNEFTENTMALFSEDISRTSDGGDAVTQAGKGFRVFRNYFQAERSGPQNISLWINHWAYKHMAHGVFLVNTTDTSLNIDVPGSQWDTVTEWRTNFYTMCRLISGNSTIFMHPNDLILADQDPGVSGAQHGRYQLDILCDLNDYLKDVSIGFADMTEHFPDVSINAAGS